MTTFTVPVIHTTIGWIRITADNLDEAKKEAKRINLDGVKFDDIQDPQTESEVLSDELEEEKY